MPSGSVTEPPSKLAPASSRLRRESTSIESTGTVRLVGEDEPAMLTACATRGQRALLLPAPLDDDASVRRDVAASLPPPAPTDGAATILPEGETQPCAPKRSRASARLGWAAACSAVTRSSASRRRARTCMVRGGFVEGSWRVRGGFVVSWRGRGGFVEGSWRVCGCEGASASSRRARTWRGEGRARGLGGHGEGVG